MILASTQESTLCPIMIGVCLDGLTHALADRPGIPEAHRAAHAGATRSLILAFKPQDALQLMAASQGVLFAALAADGLRDLVSATSEPLKPRARSSIIAMGRLVSKHMDTLIKLQGGPKYSMTTTEDVPISPAESEPSIELQSDIEVTEIEPAADPTAPLVQSDPASTARDPAEARPHPGREKMLAARSSHPSRRTKRLLVRKLANVLRQAMPSGGRALG
ncbi:MAG: hypothetical protein EXR07_03490 [Acetobacteraceae bacterium]|nr:hypothetical protein [Acetobacteraceae bacterium]